MLQCIPSAICECDILSQSISFIYSKSYFLLEMHGIIPKQSKAVFNICTVGFQHIRSNSQIVCNVKKYVKRRVEHVR